MTPIRGSPSAPNSGAKGGLVEAVEKRKQPEDREPSGDDDGADGCPVPQPLALRGDEIGCRRSDPVVVVVRRLADGLVSEFSQEGNLRAT